MEEYKEENIEYIAKNTSIVSVGNWILTLVILCIPFVNLVMLFIWVFSNGTPASKSNFAKAALIVWVVLFLLTLLFWGSISRYMGTYYPVV